MPDTGVVLRFFGAWICLTISGVIVVFGGGIAMTILLDLFGGGSGNLLVLTFWWTVAGIAGSMLMGWPFAMLRGRIVGPRFPFLKKGYLVVMALALIPFTPFLFYGQWQVLFFAVAVQAPMLAMTAIYLGFSFVFGLFGPDSPPIWRWRTQRLDGRVKD